MASLNQAVGQWLLHVAPDLEEVVAATEAGRAEAQSRHVEATAAE